MSSWLDLRELLGVAPVYRCFQRLLGGAVRQRFVTSYLKPESGQRVLDIGCGPADILDHLPEVCYVGIDISRKYIDEASRRYGNRGEFHCQRVSESTIDQFGAFDLVIAHGIVHHLDDGEARSLFHMAASALKPGGRLVTVDGCFVEGQSRLARRLLLWDRGQYVRNRPAYLRLAQNVFPDVQVDIRHDLLRVPYTLIIMQCRSCAAATADRPASRAA